MANDALLQALLAGKPLTTDVLSGDLGLGGLASDPRQAPITRGIAAFFQAKGLAEAKRNKDANASRLAEALVRSNGVPVGALTAQDQSQVDLYKNLGEGGLQKVLMERLQPKEGVVGEDIYGAPILIDKSTGTAKPIAIQGQEQPITPLGLPERPQGLEGLDFDIKQAETSLNEIKKQASVAGTKQIQSLKLQRDIVKDELDKAQGLRDDILTAQSAFRNRTAKIKTVIDTIDKVLPKINKLTAGFGGTALSKIPGTEATNVSKDIRTITSNLGFDELMEMRKASKTGGALGAVSERELLALQSTKGNLESDQKPEQFRDNLISVREQLINSLNETPTAFKDQYGFDIGVELPSFGAPQTTRIIDFSELD